jgi:conjugative relaxase-like TrwC/TraI family protein
MTMSIRRMTLGEGYRYLMSSVARGDGANYDSSNLTRYYAESGTPPGRFLGRGRAGLDNGRGIEAGSVVTEEHLFRMLGMLQDPVTGEQLGRAPSFNTAVGDGKGVRRPVAGFDLTFSVPKSVSAMWAIADPSTQARIHAAHLRALRFVIGYAEEHVFSSRSGKNGVLQEDVRGVIAAAFDHWDSRAGDPQLHTHVAVLNRVQTTDGTWRTLDSRSLFKSAVAMSELYNGVLSDHLTAGLGVGWQPTTRRLSLMPKFEIIGVPGALREEFSQRSKDIEGTSMALADRYSSEHGRHPSARELLKLRQQATLMTRPAKQHHSLADLTGTWRAQASTILECDPVAWVDTLKHRNDLPLLRAIDLDDAILRDAGRVAVHSVSEKRATFSRSNVLAEALRQLHGVRFATPDDRVQVAERIATLALNTALLISPPELAHTPQHLLRSDGTSRFRPVGHELYTTRELLEAEARLLDAGRSISGPRVSEHAVDAQPLPLPLLAKLSADQAVAVERIATSGRVIDVLVGPAGTGKSTTMSGLRTRWESTFGPGTVIGLAPSATAAEVLGDELGIATENTAKWLTESAKQSDRLARIDTLTATLNRKRQPIARRYLQLKIDSLASEVDRWSLHPNQLLIIDEASLAGTYTLDALTGHARDAGAKLVLVGDWAQSSAVTAGGALHMLVRDRDNAAELSYVHRFSETWEKNASTGLRLGHADVLDTYAAHDRISGGDRALVLDALFDAWHRDVAAGRRSLMIAGDNQTVRELNQRARANRVERGDVHPGGVTTASGLIVGVGDHIVTRRNNRTLATGHGWVKNGDHWTVTATGKDGAITVQRAGGRGRVTLPRGYVDEHVALAYATNAHQAQGRTVDTAHAYVSATTQRELLYVMATRGRDGNHLYVNTIYDPDLDTQHRPVEQRAPIEMLTRVLANEGGDKSATETIRGEWNDRTSISQLWAEYETTASTDRATRYPTLLNQSGLSAQQVHAVRKSDSFGPLMAAFHDADARGLDLVDTFPKLVAGRGLTDAEDIGSVLHHRVDRWIAAAGRRQDGGAARIVGLFPHAAGVTDPDIRQALDDRRALIEQRAHDLATTAVKRRHPWAAQLGTMPDEPAARARWMKEVATIAAYRDRWNIHDRTILGPNSSSTEHTEQRRIAQQAVTRALALDHGETDSAPAPARPLARQLERSVQL